MCRKLFISRRVVHVIISMLINAGPCIYNSLIKPMLVTAQLRKDLH